MHFEFEQSLPFGRERDLNMSKEKISTNGGAKPAADFKKEEINYPISFDFKAMMDATINDDDNKQALVDVFDKLGIEHHYHDKKISSKGTYVSLTYKITIVSKEKMQQLYKDIKSVKGLKFAL